MTSKFTIQTLVRKVSAELESGDKTPTMIQHITGLSFKDIGRALAYMKMYGFIENHGEAVHLRPAAPEALVSEVAASEAPADPAPVRESDLTPAVPVVQTSAPVIPEPPAPVPTLTATVAAAGAQRLAALIAERDALKADNARLRVLVDQKKRGLRYVAAAGRVNAATIAVALTESKTAAAPPAPAWHDQHTLASLRAVWPGLSAAEKEDMYPIRLLDELCKPPHERGLAYNLLIRRTPCLGLTPAEASSKAARHA